MRKIIDEGASRGLHTILARIAGENGPSIHLHEELGFKKVGTMKEVGKKFDQLLDVHLYQLIFK